MKSVLSIGMIAALSLGITACGAAKRNEVTKSVDGAKEAGLVKETVRCFSTTTYFMPTADGSTPAKSRSETVIVSNRSVARVANGSEIALTEATQTTTTFDVSADANTGAPVPYESKYTTSRESTSTKLANGDIKDSGKIRMTISSDGTDTTTETTYEEVSRTVGGVKKTISSKENGKDMPVYDYQTTETSKNGVKTTRTVLKTPYVDASEGAGWSIESSDQVCTTTPQK